LDAPAGAVIGVPGKNRLTLHCTWNSGRPLSRQAAAGATPDLLAQALGSGQLTLPRGRADNALQAEHLRYRWGLPPRHTNLIPMLQYLTIPVTPFQQNCSIVWCDATRKAAIIDPGGDLDMLPANSTTPTKARSICGAWNTTWPGVWPGQWRTFSVSLPIWT
jgi:hypothetical protein